VKKSILVILATIALVSIMVSVACAAAIAPKTIKTNPADIKVGFSIYTEAGPYFAAMTDTIRAKCTELGMSVITANADDSLSKQLTDIEDMLQQDIDILILNPKDPKALMDTCATVQSRGIPVVVIDNPMDPASEITTTVTSDNYTIGKLVGEWTAGQFRDKKAIIGFLSGQVGSLASDYRRTGFVTGFTEQSLRDKNGVDFQIVTQGWGNWNTADGQSAAEDMLTAFPEINLLVAENDSMALGALNVINERGIGDKIMAVACADGQKEAFALIKANDPIYKATGLNSPFLACDGAISLILKIMAGESVPSMNYTEAVAVINSNVDKYYNPDAIF
jgi:ribose transport system substrate-binding protein